jgi:hypothetical protein
MGENLPAHITAQQVTRVPPPHSQHRYMPRCAEERRVPPRCCRWSWSPVFQIQRIAVLRYGHVSHVLHTGAQERLWRGRCRMSAEQPGLAWIHQCNCGVRGVGEG